MITEYSDLSLMMENVDAALEALESQSDELFDEVKLMLEEVRKDKSELNALRQEDGDNSHSPTDCSAQSSVSGEECKSTTAVSQNETKSGNSSQNSTESKIMQMDHEHS